MLELYRKAGIEPCYYELLKLETSFPGGCAEGDCRAFATDGELGLMIARSLDPLNTGHAAIESAIAYRSTDL